jgi:glycine betaine/choline ABC-type transport system substrate-binding protein
MAITTTWSINDMKRNDADGGVILVYWSLVAQSDGTPSYSATEGGKLRLTYDASDPNFIAYDSLTEADVLGWVYNSLIEGDETATESKTRIETERTAKVQGQIDRASSESSGMPW